MDPNWHRPRQGDRPKVPRKIVRRPAKGSPSTFTCRFAMCEIKMMYQFSNSILDATKALYAWIGSSGKLQGACKTGLIPAALSVVWPLCRLVLCCRTQQVRIRSVLRSRHPFRRSGAMQSADPLGMARLKRVLVLRVVNEEHELG